MVKKNSIFTVLASTLLFVGCGQVLNSKTSSEGEKKITWQDTRLQVQNDFQAEMARDGKLYFQPDLAVHTEEALHRYEDVADQYITYHTDSFELLLVEENRNIKISYTELEYRGKLFQTSKDELYFGNCEITGANSDEISGVVYGNIPATLKKISDKNRCVLKFTLPLYRMDFLILNSLEDLPRSVDANYFLGQLCWVDLHKFAINIRIDAWNKQEGTSMEMYTFQEDAPKTCGYK